MFSKFLVVRSAQDAVLYAVFDRIPKGQSRDFVNLDLFYCIPPTKIKMYVYLLDLSFFRIIGRLSHSSKICDGTVSQNIKVILKKDNYKRADLIGKAFDLKLLN